LVDCKQPVCAKGQDFPPAAGAQQVLGICVMSSGSCSTCIELGVFKAERQTVAVAVSLSSIAKGRS
jgi:hypothetical protein